MHLILSSNEPWNARYSNEEGQALYKTSSPWKMLGRDVSIHKIMPNASEDDLQDRFAHLAQVEYNQFRSSRIRYGGGEVVTSQYFTMTGFWGAFGR